MDQGALILASPGNLNESEEVVVARAQLKEGSHGPRLKGLAYDLAHMNNYFTEKHINILDSIYRLQLRRNEVISILRGFFQQKLNIYWVYYGGHGGENTGNWCLTDGSISCQDVLRLWEEANPNANQMLLVIIDCCHSGAWLKELRAAQNNSKAWNCGILTSCAADEICFDGDFTPKFVNDFKEEPEKTRQFGMFFAPNAQTNDFLAIKNFIKVAGDFSELFASTYLNEEFRFKEIGYGTFIGTKRPPTVATL